MIGSRITFEDPLNPRDSGRGVIKDKYAKAGNDHYMVEEGDGEIRHMPVNWVKTIHPNLPKSNRPADPPIVPGDNPRG